MAKRSHTRAHRKGGSAKTVFGVIAVILALALLVYVILSAFVYKTWNPVEWFNKPAEEPTETSETSGMFIELEEPNEGAPMSLTAATPKSAVTTVAKAIETIDSPARASGNTVTLSVTINPAEASIQTCSWGCAWTSAGDAWISGKNVMEYIQLQPGADTKSCEVTCLQPFGATISIICTSDDKADGTISATCKAQYAKRITNGNLNLYNHVMVDNEEGSNPPDMSTDSTTGYEALSQTNNVNTAFSFNYNSKLFKPDENWFTQNASEYFIYGNYYLSYISFTPTEYGTGTVYDLPAGNDGSVYLVASDDDHNKGKASLMTVNLAVADGVAGDVQSRLGISAFGKYAMDGANLDMPAAFDTIFTAAVMANRTNVYNVLQPYFQSGTPVLQFEISFTGVSGNSYMLKFGVKVDCTPLRTPVQSLPGMPGEVIF